MNWIQERMPTDETQLALTLSLAAATVILPAGVIAMAPFAAGIDLFVLLSISFVLVLLTGLSGSYFWFVAATLLVSLSCLESSGSRTTDVIRYAVVGSSLLASMEVLRFAHLARRGGHILQVVYQRVFGSWALVAAVMAAVGIGAAYYAESRRFPSWLLLTAIIVGGVLALLWGRTVASTAKEGESVPT